MTKPPDAQTKSVTPKRIALTGGIASGKSLIQQYLTEMGIPNIDADAVVHQLYETDSHLIEQIRSHFGDGVIDTEKNPASVNRQALGPLVFNHPEQKKLLEQWVHPKVRTVIQRFFKEQTSASLAVAIIPQLFESGQETEYDAVWLVHTSPDQQLKRLMEQRGYTKEHAQERITCQMPYEEKLVRLKALPDWDVIENNSDEASLKQALQSLLIPAQA